MKKQILKICPPESSFKDCKTEVRCPVSDCSKILFSSGCLRMHLSRSHGITETDGDAALLKRVKMSVDVYKEYHCPSSNCIYNINSERHFKNMAGLKQHFLKVHAEKKFKCNKCGNGFGMEKDKRRHEGHCGVKYSCPTCQCTYLSAEALVLHCLRTQHPVPREYDKQRKTGKKRPKEKTLAKTSVNETFSSVSTCPSSCFKIPVILLPVSDSSMKLIQNQIKTVPIQPKPSQNRKPVDSCFSSNHLLDHDYLPLDVTAEKNRNKKQTTDTLSSEMQTEISLPPLNMSKTIAETQTSADRHCILTEAMASADIPVEYTSIGTQVTSDYNGKVDMQTQVTPKSKFGEIVTDRQSHQQDCRRKKKLYVKHSAQGKSRKRHSGNTKVKEKTPKDECLLSSSNNFDAYELQASYNPRSFLIGTSNTTETTTAENQAIQTSVSSSGEKLTTSNNAGISMSASISSFDFVQTVGVQTYSRDYQDFLLSQSNMNNGIFMGTNSVGINTENKLSNKCVGNTPLFSDSNVQTVDFDFLANSPEPQIEAIHMETQTVDLDIDSLESIVSSIQTQTAGQVDLESSFSNVETQTRDRYSSVDTQTLANSSFDCAPMESTNIETQTYDEHQEFIELLSSGTQTLDLGLFQDAPLSLIHIETQTAEINNSSLPINFGTQTSVNEGSQISKEVHFNMDKDLSNNSCCSAGTETEIPNPFSDRISRKKNDFRGEQMEFLVSEVLEMIPVTENPYSDNSIASRSSKVPSVDAGNNADEEIFKADVGINAEFATSSFSNSNIHTQTILDTTNIQTQTSRMGTQELTNSETQTTGQRSTVDIDLTDSHTQTTWKELNDLLAELDR